MIAGFLSNISAKYYKNPSMLSRVIVKNVGDVFFETQCIYLVYHIALLVTFHDCKTGSGKICIRPMLINRRYYDNIYLCLLQA